MTPETPSLPPIFFNHLYIVLDDKTYRAIQGSEFLRIAFPGVERRSTLTAAGETWNGTYFYCQDNYLEFFGAGNGPMTGKATRSGHWQAGAQEGWAGLAFSSDKSGGAAAVRQALQSAFGYEPFSELRQLRAGDQHINWFYNVKLAERLGLGSFDSWVMEYHPDIFAHKRLTTPPSGELTRRAYLAPWNKERTTPLKDAPPPPPEPVLPEDELADSAAPTITGGSSGSGRRAAKSSAKQQHNPVYEAKASPENRPADGRAPGNPGGPVFSRVIGATIHMDHRRAERYAEILGLFGYAQEKTGDSLALSAHGFTLLIQPEERAPSGYRLSSLRLAMSRPSVAPMTFVFAPRSRLVLNADLTADWVFGV